MLSLYSGKVKSEEIVQYEVALSSSLLKMEYFSEHHWLSIVDFKFTGYASDDSVVSRWLTVKCVYLMFDLAETGKLSKDSLLTHELFSLKGEHGLVREKLNESL